MATTREIKRRIKSARNISQVTRAMQMVSAVKMRKAQEAAVAGREYVNELSRIVGVLSERSELDKDSHFLRNDKGNFKTIVLVVAPKKGLCGGLVSNLFRQVLGIVGQEEKNSDEGKDFSFVTVEKKSKDIVRVFGKELLADFALNGKRPTMESIRPISDFLVEKFTTGSVGRVLIVYTQFINTVSQKATVKQFLPVNPSEIIDQGKIEGHQDRKPGATFIFEPSAKEVTKAIFERYCEATLYQIVLEASAAEHSARMVAMKNATDNAMDVISDLTLFYNQARQNMITNELVDAMSSRMAQT